MAALWGRYHRVLSCTEEDTEQWEVKLLVSSTEPVGSSPALGPTFYALFTELTHSLWSDTYRWLCMQRDLWVHTCILSSPDVTHTSCQAPWGLGWVLFTTFPWGQRVWFCAELYFCCRLFSPVILQPLCTCWVLEGQGWTGVLGALCRLWQDVWPHRWSWNTGLVLTSCPGCRPKDQGAEQKPHWQKWAASTCLVLLGVRHHASAYLTHEWCRLGSMGLECVV